MIPLVIANNTFFNSECCFHTMHSTAFSSLLKEHTNIKFPSLSSMFLMDFLSVSLFHKSKIFVKSCDLKSSICMKKSSQSTVFIVFFIFIHSSRLITFLSREKSLVLKLQFLRFYTFELSQN